MTTRLNPMRSLWGALLACASCFCAYQAWNDAHFAYLRQADPAAAYKERPTDALSLSKALDVKLGKQPGSPISPDNLRHLRAAIIEAPLSRALLRIAGVKAELDGNAAKADGMMLLSNAVSRRDALTQLWLIERSVRRDDMKSAIAHYHAALSVHPELGAALFPILSKAIAFPEVRAAIAPYIARQARWSADLIGAATLQGNPTDVALLIIPVGDMARGEAYDAISAQLISRLAELGEFTLARQLAGTLIEDLNNKELDALEVNDTTTDKRLGKLAWSFPTDGSILTSANGLGGFDIDIGPLAHGRAATRTIPVTGGRTYIFSQTLRGASGDDLAAALSWRASCSSAQSSQPVWEQILPPPRQTQRYESTIAVPTGCKGLALTLVARGSDGQQSAHLAIEALALRQRAN